MFCDRNCALSLLGFNIQGHLLLHGYENEPLSLLPTANLRRDFCKELETALYVTLSKQKFFTVTVSGYVPRLARLGAQ